ncbi:nucleotidyltransferase family protein [Ruminococcus sp. FC2018]|uniref:nucleotidyltransferase domain-containing protein n=1 Tax=Ruminococcus sp. FC2018 TaxID=1410617 RepID=UPI0004906E07|nr:nucleotidyltransferase family protein [Ruminococcus sp. FC2018]
MTKHDYKQNAYYLMYLIRCILNKKTPAKEKLDKMDLSGLFVVAKGHSLTAIAAYALESAGIYDKDFEEEKNKAIRKTIILDAERENVLAELEKACIWYMPLKGILIKDLYPQIGMRQMADNDILFDKIRAEDVRTIMQSFGFKTKNFDSGNHDIYYKSPVCNFEIHTELFGDWHQEEFYTYFSNIFQKVIKDSENGYGYHLSVEDFYIYITAHNYKHYSSGGTGLRSLVDTYVYLNHYAGKLDMKYIENECEKLGIAEYEKQTRDLSLHLLGGKKLTAGECKMFDYIIFSGTYGTIDNIVSNTIKKNNNGHFEKIKYICQRLMVPVSEKNEKYRIFASYYPWFYKSKARLPLLFFYRIGSIFTSKRSRAKAEISALRKI